MHAELSFSSDSQAVNISRMNRSFVACHLLKTRFPSPYYQSQLYVYDWEPDDTVGTVTVPVEMVFSKGAPEACGMASGGTTNMTPSNPGVCQFNCVGYF